MDEVDGSENASKDLSRSSVYSPLIVRRLFRSAFLFRLASVLRLSFPLFLDLRSLN